MNHPTRAERGIILILGAMACFSVVDTLSKIVGATLSVVLVMTTRYAFQTVVTGAMLLPRRGRSLFFTRHPVLQFVRGLLLLLSSSLAFTSLRFFPIGEFTAIQMLTPLAITLLAAVSLGERVSALRWGLVIGAFIGALIVLRHDADDIAWITLLPVGCVVSSVVFQLLTHQLARTDDPGTMHFYTGCVGVLVSALALPFAWSAPHSGWLWAALLTLALFSSIGHYLLILGYGHASPATVTPFLYTQIAFATLAGWLVFAHAPDATAVVGSVLIAACGIAATRLTARDKVPVIDQE